MTAIQSVLSAVPIEKELKDLVETPALHILLDETDVTEKKAETVLKAVRLYVEHTADAAVLLVSDKYKSNTELQKYCHAFLPPDCVRWFDFSSDNSLLTALLGCDALITMEENSKCVELASKLYLPVVIAGDDEKCHILNGRFFVESTVPAVAAALELMKENEYRPLLSGFGA